MPAVRRRAPSAGAPTWAASSDASVASSERRLTLNPPFATYGGHQTQLIGTHRSHPCPSDALSGSPTLDASQDAWVRLVLGGRRADLARLVLSAIARNCFRALGLLHRIDLLGGKARPRRDPPNCRAFQKRTPIGGLDPMRRNPLRLRPIRTPSSPRSRLVHGHLAASVRISWTAGESRARSGFLLEQLVRRTSPSTPAWMGRISEVGSRLTIARVLGCPLARRSTLEPHRPSRYVILLLGAGHTSFAGGSQGGLVYGPDPLALSPARRRRTCSPRSPSGPIAPSPARSAAQRSDVDDPYDHLPIQRPLGACRFTCVRPPGWWLLAFGA